MATPAIRVEGLGKRYRLVHGQERARYRTLRDSIAALASAPFRKRSSVEEFWALNDVFFEVQPGEVVGIIGRNGAGKSTLLKLLSRITKPTTGRVEINGRVGSLLEVGTGFHPELTGRENIYLNGSILGMSQREIGKKFHEIVAFAEVEKFLDTPVKRYSSGMYVRLAFAVAAYLEPEILIVDEVLAVGDATFQKRCIDRMTELAGSGRTVLFVSHNMQLVPRLCRKAILLNKGRVVAVGDATEMTSQYLEQLLDRSLGGCLANNTRTGDGRARFVRAELVGQSGTPVNQFRSGDDLTIRMEVESTCTVFDPALAVVLQTLDGSRFMTSWTREQNFKISLSPGRQTFECRFLNAPLRPGHTIRIMLWLADGAVMDSVDNAIVTDVIGDQSHAGLSHNPDQGVVLCNYSWRDLTSAV